MGRNQAPVGRRRTEQDPHTLTSEQAAKALGVNKNRFGTYWDPIRKGWHIPIGADTAFVPNIGDSDRKRRVPKALVLEIANYGRVTA